MNEILRRSARNMAALIRSRKVSAVEVLRAHLEHIEAQNPAINALVQVDAQRARRQASEIDESIARGEPAGPLAGVPFTVKDNLETAGVITAVGVRERSETIPDRDATVVQRMKASGAILLGKTNCPPWGGGLETDNPVYGRTSNPYDLDRTPGGSSGGEAAAIASGMSACGLGSDSGGSLRYPAHFCGIATIKPTPGLVPLTGALDDLGQFGALRDPRTQVGPMARGVEDVALMLRILAGSDGLDASIAPVPIGNHASVEMSRLRVRVQTDNGEVAPTGETLKVLEAAARTLDECGADVEHRELPDEGLGLTREIWRSYGGEMTTGELYRLLADWDRYRSRLLNWFRDADVLLRPVNATPAPGHGATDVATLYTTPFSLTGWPAATVRCGVSSEGLPIGLQVAAHPWRDHVALAVAVQLEEALGGWQPVPESTWH